MPFHPDTFYCPAIHENPDAPGLDDAQFAARVIQASDCRASEFLFRPKGARWLPVTSVTGKKMPISSIFARRADGSCR
jgi:hypothetical protein